MNTTRYVIAGAVSMLVHGVLLSAVPSHVAMAMPAGTDSTRVSVNLVTAPQTAPPKTTAQQPAPQAVKQPDSPAEPTASPQTENANAPKKTRPQPEASRFKKRVKKSQPVADKPVKHKPTPELQQPQPVAKKAVTEPAVEQAAEQPVAAPEDKPVAKNIETQSKPSSDQPPQVAPAAAGVNSKPELVSRPTFATRPSPLQYPSLAKRRGIEGLVKVEVWVDPNGKQVKHVLVESSGAQVLDQAALDTIKRWHFSSHIVNGQAIAHRVQIPVRFQLD